MTKRGELTPEDVSQFEKDAKIGLLATVDPQGLPHVSLITSIQAKRPDQLMFGQFCEGLSKKHVKNNPRTGFLVMSPERELWRGKARWTGEAKSGEDYEMYNRKPMFRYNSYFGIHTVHYLELVEFSGKESVSTVGIVLGSLATGLARRLGAATPREAVLRPWAEKLLERLGTLKFLSYIGQDGYPAIVPLVPSQPAGSARLIFAAVGHRAELAAIPRGSTVAVFALNLQMESVLVRGCLTGYRRYVGFRTGAIDIDWIYNSMPPMQGPVFPTRRVLPVTDHQGSA